MDDSKFLVVHHNSDCFTPYSPLFQRKDLFKCSLLVN